MDSSGGQLRRREEARRNLILAGWVAGQTKQTTNECSPSSATVGRLCLLLCAGVEEWGNKARKKVFGFVGKEYERRRMELLNSIGIEIEIDLM
jgi:hypothetical protein